MSNQVGAALAGGLLGACALTLIHETARRSVPHAPRVDVLGERALQRALRAAGRRAPDRRALYLPTLAGDLASNALFYALVGFGGREGALWRGTTLGLLGGAGTVVLAPALGLGPQPGEKAPHTQWMTLLWYTLGGMAAGAAYRALR